MKTSYVRADDAPEGTIRVLLGNSEFVFEGDKAVEVDDLVLQADLDAQPYLKRAEVKRSEAKAQAREAKNRENAVMKAQAKADKFNAEKDPLEDAKSADDFLEGDAE